MFVLIILYLINTQTAESYKPVVRLDFHNYKTDVGSNTLRTVKLSPVVFTCQIAGKALWYSYTQVQH